MLRRHLRNAIRVHLKRPVLSATVVATLALGIGANTAIFSIVDGILLRPLAYPESDRIVRLYQSYETLRTSPNTRLRAIWDRLPVSYLNTVDYRRESRTISTIGLYTERSVTFQGSGEPEEIEAAGVDAELFEVLGVRPVLGRTFEPGEVERQERLVVLSHELWQRLYGGGEGVLGRTLSLDGEPYTVVGVMPRGFDVAGGRRDRLWTPLELGESDLSTRDDQRLNGLGRLAPGVTLDRVREEMDRLAAGQAEAFPDTNAGTGVGLVPLLETLVDKSRGILSLLVASVAAVLAVACVNVAHLLLSQAGARRGELAIRLALGASRGRLAVQLLTESLVLAVAGGALGLLIASSGLDFLLKSIPADLPRTEEIAIDGRVLAFTLAVSLAAALVCGLLPAFSSSAASSHAHLRAGRTEGGRGGLAPHSGFVVAEIALTLVLTAGAGLLVNSFLRLSAVDAGFRTEGLFVQDVRLPPWRYADESRRQELSARFLERLSALPGVESAAFTSKLPFAGPALVAGFRVPGLDSEDQDWTQGRSASMKFVTPGYFATLGIPVLAGRGFTDADRPESGRVLVMNETLAEKTWPGQDAVGRTVIHGDESYRVVGVVGDVRHDGLGNETGVLMYQPWSQRGEGPMSQTLTAVAAVEGDPLDLAGPVRQVLRELDPALPLPAATTMEELMAESLGTPRSRTSLVSLLSVIALVLALVGTYAVMSFTVEQRVREIGIRMALGADASRVRGWILRRTLALTALGIGSGILGAVFGSRLLEGLLYGVGTTDPATLAAAAALLTLTALAAGVLPAVKASRVEPVSALRSE